MKNCGRFLFLAALAGVAMAALAPPGWADFTLTISDGKETISIDWDTKTVAISGTGTTNATNGSFSSQGGGLTISQSSPPPGFTQSIGVIGLTLDGLSIFASAANSAVPGPPAQISMGGINISGTSSGTTLTFNEQSTGFISPTTNLTSITSGDILASNGVSATYTTQVNGTNYGSVVIPPNSNSPVYTNVGSVASGYTLGGVLAITLPANSSVTDISTQSQLVTPAPSSMVLLASGAVGLIGYGWRRRQFAVA